MNPINWSKNHFRKGWEVILKQWNFYKKIRSNNPKSNFQVFVEKDFIERYIAPKFDTDSNDSNLNNIKNNPKKIEEIKTAYQKAHQEFLKAREKELLPKHTYINAKSIFNKYLDPITIPDSDSHSKALNVTWPVSDDDLEDPDRLSSDRLSTSSRASADSNFS